MTTQFVVDEIREGRLVAFVLKRPGKRAIYRISTEELEAYCVRYQWMPLTQLRTLASQPNVPSQPDKPTTPTLPRK